METLTNGRICGYEVHPAATLFPLIEGEEFDALVEDISVHGQIHPITLDNEGRIIDGRNRARVCERLKVVLLTVPFTGDDPTAYAVSSNLHRRNLTDAQRAMIAAKIATREVGYRGFSGRQSDDIITLPLPPSLADAAQLLAVAKPQVITAKRVIRDGTPDLAALVADGKAPIATAARVATKLTPEEQDAYAANVRAGADPVKTAPPGRVREERRKASASKERPPAPPKFGARRRHREQIEALIAALEGAVTAFEDVTSLDQTVDAGEAARLTGGLTKQIRSLNRINSLIKERTQ